MKDRALFLVWLAALTSCTVGPQYHPPSLPIATTWRAASGQSAASVPWWTAFEDPVLNRLETEALGANLTVEQALARVEQSRGALATANAALLPSGEGDATVARSEQSLNSGLGQLSRYVPTVTRSVDFGQLKLAASWELDFVGGLRREREAARANFDAATADVDAARLGVCADLADAYVSMRGAQAERTAWRTLVTLFEAQNRIMAVRVRAGAAPLEALQASTAVLKDAEARLPVLDGAVETQRNRIAVLLGQSPSVAIDDLASFGPVPSARDPAIGVPAEILRQRPDVVAVEQKLKAATAGIGVALSQYYPKVSLSALIGQESNSFGALFASGSTIAQGGMGLRWRLFDFDRIGAEVRIARGHRREALAAYRDVVLRASEDVENGFVELNSARRRVALLIERRAATVAVATSAERAWQVGDISRDDRVSAERAVAQVDADLAVARRDEARAVIACNRALGASFMGSSRQVDM